MLGMVGWVALFPVQIACRVAGDSLTVTQAGLNIAADGFDYLGDRATANADLIREMRAECEGTLADLRNLNESEAASMSSHELLERNAALTEALREREKQLAAVTGRKQPSLVRTQEEIKQERLDKATAEYQMKTGNFDARATKITSTAGEVTPIPEVAPRKVF